jgi:glycine hydroxymethyltransferase
MCDEKHRAAIDKAVFPGLQGGPHNSTSAGIAVAAKEAATDGFKEYAQRIVVSAQALADKLLSHGFALATGGTDNHLVLADLTPFNVPGKVAAKALDEAGLVCNYNSVPFDTRKPFDPSGIRLGTPAICSRGMGPKEATQVGEWIAQVVKAPDDTKLQQRVRAEVKALCDGFPAPGLPQR